MGRCRFCSAPTPKSSKRVTGCASSSSRTRQQIWLVALPKFQAQAADFRAVEVILDRQRLLPTHMQVHLPNGDRHMYTFDIASATINSPLQKLQVAL